MSFCGQCGFQLAPEDTRCPRCGAIVEPEGALSPLPATDASPNDATVESRSYLNGGTSQGGTRTTQSPPFPSVSQPKLVLGSHPYNAPDANEATSMMDTPIQASPRMATSSPGYIDPYVSPQTVYPPYGGSSYPDYHYPPAAPARRKSPRSAGLVFILLGILLILGALVLFALQHNGILGGSTSGSATATPIVNSPIQQAQGVIQQYYNSVNQRDYTTAYHLWKNNTQKLSDFQNGYRYTEHTDVAFGTGQIRSDGKVYLPVTITATERVASTQKTKTSTYSGYYLVEKQADGTWLIFDGDLKPAA